MSTIIAPSILSADFLNLEHELLQFQGFNDLWIHLDIMDAHFVPNLTFGIPIIKAISNLKEYTLDAHLMVSDPLFFIKEFKKLNLKIQNISYHLESTQKHLDIIQEAKGHFPSLGLALRPETPLENIPEELLENFNLILIMSVSPGFSGQGFIQSTYEKVKKLRKIRKTKKLNFQIQVDGGINNTNSQKLVKSGANILVAGNYIFKNNDKNYHQAVKNLRL